MKFFTSEWWRRAGNGDYAPLEKYDAYFASIRSSLPAALVVLSTEYALHDARVMSISGDFESRQLVMVLAGWNRMLEYRVLYTLTFSGVSVFDQKLPHDRDCLQELGDLGYWECELLDSAKIEVRMLFVSEAEFRVVFSDFDFSHEAVKV